MLIGYARVSTDDQNLDFQNDALRAAGCERILHDRISGARADRPGLSRALDLVRAGDVLVVWRLDCLSRSLKELIAQAETLAERKVGLRSITEAIDTTTSGGKLVFHVFGALAEFERNLIRERTQAGLEAARARGRKGGRRKLLSKEKRRHVVELHQSRQYSVREICSLMGISRPTLYAYLAEFSDEKGKVQAHAR